MNSTLIIALALMADSSSSIDKTHNNIRPKLALQGTGQILWSSHNHSTAFPKAAMNSKPCLHLARPKPGHWSLVTESASTYFERFSKVFILTLSSYLTSDKQVKIFVGPEKKMFVLDEELLCERVDYFRGCFKSGFKESQKKVLNLVDDDGEAFTHVVDWVYGHSLECEDGGAHHPLNMQKHLLHWIKTWILADKLGMDDLATRTVDLFALCLEDNWNLEREEVSYVYRNTLESSPLRSILVQDMVRYFFDADGFREKDWEIVKDCGAVFFMDVSKATRAHHLLSAEDCDWEDDCTIHSSKEQNDSPV